MHTQALSDGGGSGAAAGAGGIGKAAGAGGSGRKEILVGGKGFDSEEALEAHIDNELLLGAGRELI